MGFAVVSEFFDGFGGLRLPGVANPHVFNAFLLEYVGERRGEHASLSVSITLMALLRPGYLEGQTHMLTTNHCVKSMPVLGGCPRI